MPALHLNMHKNSKFMLINKYFEIIIAGLCLIIMFLLIVIQIILRYFFRTPILWINDAATILFIWAILVGVGAAIKNYRLISIDLIYIRLNQKLQLIMELIVTLLMVYASLQMFQGGMSLIQRYGGDTLPLSKIPRFYLYYSIPISSIVIAFRVIQRYIINLVKYKNQNPEKI